MAGPVIPVFRPGYRLMSGTSISALIYALYNTAANPYHTRRAAISGLTAAGGGGQTNATVIQADLSVFSTVVTAGDSALLPPALAGTELAVINKGASSMNVFPTNNGDTINALAVNTAFACAAGTITTFVCGAQGNWMTK